MAAELNDLKEQARKYKQSAYATSSQKTYRCQLKCYLQFCIDYKLCPLPCAQETIICYTAFLASKMLPSSIANYLNVVRILHVEAGYKNPLYDNYELAMLKRGINRVKGVAPKQKQPITLDILLKIRSSVNFGLSSDLAFRAVCVIGFFGFLRKSTLLPASSVIGGSKILTRADVVQLDLESFVLIVRNSKVIQFGQKLHSIPFAKVSDFRLCPVRALLAHFGASPLSSDKALFNFLEKGVEIFMSHSKFVSRLKLGLTFAGVDQGKFSAHSFRKGGASYAFEIGVAPLQIKQRGDWASTAFEKYVFISNKSSVSVARALSGGF